MIRLIIKLSELKNKKAADKRNQKPTPDASANMNPFRANVAKTTRNKPENEMASGNAVVAFDAISGDWVNPIKKNASNAVDGSPPTNPPVLLPNF